MQGIVSNTCAELHFGHHQTPDRIAFPLTVFRVNCLPDTTLLNVFTVNCLPDREMGNITWVEKKVEEIAISMNDM